MVSSSNRTIQKHQKREKALVESEFYPERGKIALFGYICRLFLQNQAFGEVGEWLKPTVC